MHQIFMLAFAGLRVEGEVAQVLVVSQPPPLAFLVFLLSSVLCPLPSVFASPRLLPYALCPMPYAPSGISTFS
jgi:hypothetical protein